MQKEAVNILLADDDEDDRLFFKDAISQLGISTRINTVNDGVELMDYLLRPGSTLPHVVFLDLNMPRKGGMECLAEIRSHSMLQSLSVAIYSTSSSDEDIEDTFLKGANIYINKPSDFERLKEVLNKVICTNWQYYTSNLNRENFLMSV
ncbi:response regulator [Negadavirga shengliensis]|uniref:Response regulator n=1 Tax=Negadavirga shengliensis TaxID=1389218 RepID=A0ABV9SWU5_9BACT